MDPLTKDPEKNLEDSWQSLFGSTVSGTGEEELLRLASSYSRQYSSTQIRILLYLGYRADLYEAQGNIYKAKQLRNFVEGYEKLKQYNNSDAFVMRALDSISLRKFINENTLRINVEKK